MEVRQLGIVEATPRQRVSLKALTDLNSPLRILRSRPHAAPATARPWTVRGLLQRINGSGVSNSAQRQRRQLTAPSLEPAVTSPFHPPKAAKTSPFSRSGTLK
jgi:hypothetical protein